MQNIGIGDRIARIFVGIGLLGLVPTLSGPLRWFGLLGVIPLATSMVGISPLYRMLHIRTDQPHAAH